MPIPHWFNISESDGSLLCGALYAAQGSDPAALAEVAREFSPRIEVCGPREMTLDLSGLSRLFGDARAIAEELRRTAADRGLRVRVAIAGTRTAARLMVRHRAGLTVIEPGTEAGALAALPIALIDEIHPNSQPPTANFETPNSQLPTPKFHKTAINPPTDVLRRWGLRTLGELAALPPDEVMARLGLQGIEWQRLARGEDARPLVPAVPEERFEQSLELEWPIEGLEPLSFVLGRLMEPLSAHLAQRDRGAAVLHVRLRLVTRNGAAKAVHERTLELPAPMREARTLRTLALLDLESHPPPAAIECVTVAVDPTPARVVQYSLLTRPLPTPEQLSTLMARLHALMGETRCGSPSVVNSWAPGAFAMKPFAPRGTGARYDTPRHRGTEASGGSDTPRHRGTETSGGFDTPRHRGTDALNSSEKHNGLSASVPQCVVTTRSLSASMPQCVESTPDLRASIRRFRTPIPARVQVDAGKPSRIVIDRRGLNGGRVAMCAGPWRTSGAWWHASNVPGAQSRQPGARQAGARSWDRDEWDVSLVDGVTYRLFRERSGDHWFVDGVVD